jgi:hypothetical protein
MKFDFAWLAVSLPEPDGRWVYVGVLLRDDASISFEPVPGFEVATVEVIRATERATTADTIAECWDYFVDRGAGGLSSFSEPGKIEAPTRASAVERLMRRIPAPV